jgi:hypothetical protein
VYDTFKQTILKNARKLPQLKNETKMLIDELEKQIEEVKQKGVGEEGAATQAGELNNVDMESQDDHDEENEPAVNRLTKATRQQQTQKNTVASRRGAPAETASVNTSKSNAKSKKAKTKSSTLASKFAKKGKKIDSSASSSSSNNESSSNDNSSDSD